MGDPVARGERRAVALVAVEQLDDAARLAGGAHPLVQAGDVERIDQPDAAVDDERVRGARPGLAQSPAEAALELVYPAHVHGQDGSVVA